MRAVGRTASMRALETLLDDLPQQGASVRLAVNSSMRIMAARCRIS